MTIEPTVIIDGAVPRDPWERAQKLLDYATDISAQLQVNTTDDRFFAYEQDIKTYHGNADFEWADLEDDIIQLIEDMLPVDMCVEMGLACPGDVIVTIPNGNGEDA